MKYPIPEKALTQHIAILGKTGSGKTTAAKAGAELILDTGDRLCVIDPTGAWWGMKSSATGKSAGYPIVIFGGLHADFPLSASHGEAVAEIVGTSNTPAVIDTSQMRVSERTRFFTDFADAIMRKNRGPLHLVIDESHLFAPQGKVPDPASGAMLSAANNLVSGGRSRGLRIILISQRPAKLHKDSLSQVETMVAMRLIAPQDRRAVEEWIKDNADLAKGREIIESLATLKTGQAWVWAPELGVLERVQFPRIRTFDSSAAPETGEDVNGPVLASIDKASIDSMLKTHAGQVAANDPAELKKRIRELEAQIRQVKPEAGASHADLVTARGQAFDEGYVTGKNHAIGQARSVILGKLREDIAGAIEAAASGIASIETKPAARKSAIPPSVKTFHVAPIARSRANGHASGMSKAERLVLTVLAQYPQGRTKTQIAILTGYAVTGGGFNNALSSLRGKGFIEGAGDRLQFSNAGLEALGTFEELPQGDALLRHWLGQLGKAERAALEVLAQAHPRALAKDELARRAGYESNGGGFNNALSRLRTLELVEGRGEIKASDDLF